MAAAARIKRALTIDENLFDYDDIVIRSQSNKWMVAPVFEQLWKDATKHVIGLCVNMSSPKTTTIDTADGIKSNMLEQLSATNVVVIDSQKDNRIMLYAVLETNDDAGDDDNSSSSSTLVLGTLETLEEQIKIQVKNTDPISTDKLEAFLRFLQHLFQPNVRPPSVPKRQSSSSSLNSSLEGPLPPPPPSLFSAADEDDDDHVVPVVKALDESCRVSNRTRSNTTRYRDKVRVEYEGYVMRQLQLVDNEWETRYGVVQADCTFSLYKSRDDFIQNRRLCSRYVIDSANIESNGNALHAFYVQTEGHDRHHFSCRSELEKAQWLQIIAEQVKNRRYGSSSTGFFQPFASQPFNASHTYTLLSQLLRQERSDFTTLFQSIHPDILLTSNYPPIIPYWGQFRQFSGLMVFFSSLLDTVSVESFTLSEVREVPVVAADSSLSLSSSLPSSSVISRSIIVTGKETFCIKHLAGRRITQLFVHKLSLDYKGRLIRWHINGDSVAVSVAFDVCARGHGLRLTLPNDAMMTSTTEEPTVPGMVYVQVLRGEELLFSDDEDNASEKRLNPYVRCVIEQGETCDRTLDGLKRPNDVVASCASPLAASTDEEAKFEENVASNATSKPSQSQSIFRGFSRRTGLSKARLYCDYGDPGGVVTQIVRRSTNQPTFDCNLRLEFPGSASGSRYSLKVEVFNNRFMKKDELVGVCKINLDPHLAMASSSAEARANAALPRWYNLCDQYNDCKEWWAPPTVYRGKIQLSVAFVPSNVKSCSSPPVKQPAVVVSTNTYYCPDDGVSAESLREYFSTQDGNSSNEQQRAPPSSPPFEMSSLSRDVRSSPEKLKMLSCPWEDRSHTFAGKKTEFTVPKNFHLIKVVGSGAYGEVVAASDIETGATVAIKKITDVFRDLLDTKRILRELRLLRQLRHPSLIRIWDIFPPKSYDQLQDIYIVTDLMETDLHRVIHSTQTLSDEYVAHFMYQIMKGLKYLHSASIYHRDLKPSNILVNSNCELKICDLGLARAVERERAEQQPLTNLTDYVVTRWYRAPEILLDGTRYCAKIDVWSAGCILAELLGRKPLFPGTGTLNELQRIFSILGTPTEEFTKRIIRPAAQRWVTRQPWKEKLRFRDLYPKANRLALDLLDKMLAIDPAQRISAADALEHPYLKQYEETLLNSVVVNHHHHHNSSKTDSNNTFTGKLCLKHELVSEESKEDLKKALFEDIKFFHPECSF